MRYHFSQFTAAVVLCSYVALPGITVADEPNASALGTAYHNEIRPLLEHYCHDCHGGADVVEADINLAAMKTWSDVTKHPKTWQKVREMLDNGLMPPQDAEQPTKVEREQLKKWVADDLRLEA